MLILDVRTRWSSTHQMMRKLIMIKNITFHYLLIMVQDERLISRQKLMISSSRMRTLLTLHLLRPSGSQ